MQRDIPEFFNRLLGDGVGAEVAAAAFETGFAEVEFVDPFDERGEVGGVVGEDPGFEVATGGAFGTKASSGKVSGGDEGGFAVDDDGFGVDAGAENAFEEFAFDEGGVAVEVFAKSRAGFFGMKESDCDASFYEVGEDGEKGDVAASFFDVEVFEVGSNDPEVMLSIWHEVLDDAVIDLVVEDEFGHEVLVAVLAGGEMKTHEREKLAVFEREGEEGT